MLKPAFSTVACPEWTLSQVAQRASTLGFEAVELRTFGYESRQFACDPAMSSESKVRSMFLEAGVEVLSLATGVRFDEPIFPPILGLYLPQREKSVREGQRAVDLAVGLECPYVRVFGFEFPARERRASAMKRICDRLKMVVDHADKSGVKVVVENGGAFETAASVMEIIEQVGHPLLGVSYSLSTGVQAGEDPISAIRLIGQRLWVTRIKDVRAGKAVHLGTGELPAEGFVKGLLAAGFAGPMVYEWDRAWDAELGPAEPALSAASAAIWKWIGETQGGRRETPKLARR